MKLSSKISRFSLYTEKPFAMVDCREQLNYDHEWFILSWNPLRNLPCNWILGIASIVCDYAAEIPPVQDKWPPCLSDCLNIKLRCSVSFYNSIVKISLLQYLYLPWSCTSRVYRILNSEK